MKCMFKFKLLKKVYLHIFASLFLFALLPALAMPWIYNTSEPAEKKLSSITQGWQYRWGDSPVNNQNKPLWIYDKHSSSSWSNYKVPGYPPENNKGKIAWIRNKLPDMKYTNPGVYLKLQEQYFEAYLEDTLIYSYGKVSAPEWKLSLGETFHFINLPSEYEGKYIYIRTYSPYSGYQGDIQEAVLGSMDALHVNRVNEITNLIKLHIDYIFLSGVFVLIGLVMMFFFVSRGFEQKAYFSLGLSSICIGIWLVAESKISLIFLPMPVIWQYAGYISIQLMPVGFCAFIEEVFGGSNRLFLKRIWITFILYTITTILLHALNLVYFSQSILLFHIMLVITMVIAVITVAKSARQGNRDAKIFTRTFVVLSVFGIYDIIDMYYYPIPLMSGHHITPWSMLIFIMSLAYILSSRFVDVYTRLEAYTKEIENKNAVLSSISEELRDSRDQISEWNKSLELKIRNKTSEIKSLLDNAGQGFLTFDSSLSVGKEYSAECKRIFGKSIDGTKISDLLCPDIEQRQYLDALMLKILEEKNSEKRAFYISLLPSELIIDNKYISADYKLIESIMDGKQKMLMVIFTDITDKKSLQCQVENERNILKMIVSVVTNRDYFIRYINNYNSFCNAGIREILNGSGTLTEKVYEIFRQVHNFKGGFCQIDMVNITEKLHIFENNLNDLKKHIDSLTLDDVIEFLQTNNISQWLDEDIGILRDFLGDKFFLEENTVIIAQTDLEDMNKKMFSVLPPNEYKVFSSCLNRLTYKSFKELLRTYPVFVLKKAKTLGKLVDSFEIEGVDVYVDSQKYQSFTDSLIHIFSNIIVHGLELPAERTGKGKKESGRVTCKIEKEGDYIILIISDDGRGINIEKLRQKAFQMGIIDSEEAKTLTPREIAALSFSMEVTTSEEADKLSGRGIGLSSVKDCLEKIGGRVDISSEEGKGTEYRFYVPAIESFTN